MREQTTCIAQRLQYHHNELNVFFLNSTAQFFLTWCVLGENCQHEEPTRVSYWTIVPGSVDQLKSLGSRGCQRTLLTTWLQGMVTVGGEIFPSRTFHKWIVLSNPIHKISINISWTKDCNVPPLKISRPDVKDGATCRIESRCAMVESRATEWAFAKYRHILWLIRTNQFGLNRIFLALDFGQNDGRTRCDNSRVWIQPLNVQNRLHCCLVS